MKKVILLILPLLSLVGFDVAAQKVQDNIDKAANDPKRAENSAKADIYIQKKNRSIMDSTQFVNQKTSATTKKKKTKRCSKS